MSIRFPDDYRRFLTTYGWLDTPVLQINGLGASVPKHVDIVAETTIERTAMHPPMPAYLIPISNDGSGSHYCLNTLSATMPELAEVVYFAHDDPLGPSQITELVARSMDEWVALMLKGLDLNGHDSANSPR